MSNKNTLGFLNKMDELLKEMEAKRMSGSKDEKNKKVFFLFVFVSYISFFYRKKTIIS